MRVTGLDGKAYSWKLIGRVPLGDDEVKRSTYHLSARKLLTSLYPLDRLLEEVPLPGSWGLEADFFLPSLKLMVEVHGEQHYKFIPYFHQTYLGFIESKKRDESKKKWCEINHINFAELPYTEDIDGWRERIRKATTG